MLIFLVHLSNEDLQNEKKKIWFYVANIYAHQLDGQLSRIYNYTKSYNVYTIKNKKKRGNEIFDFFKSHSFDVFSFCSF